MDWVLQAKLGPSNGSHQRVEVRARVVARRRVLTLVCRP